MFHKGGGFKVRCTSAARKLPTQAPREQVVLELYQVTQPTRFNQFMTPTQRNTPRQSRPMTAIKNTQNTQNKLLIIEDNQTDPEAKKFITKPKLHSYRLSDKQPKVVSVRQQLDNFVDTLLKKTNTTITPEEIPQVPDQRTLTQKIARSCSQGLISDPGNVMDRYVITNNLGHGSYAVVNLARDKLTEKLVAIKTYQKSRLYNSQRRQSLKREIHILKHLEHPNIIQFVNVVETQNEINLITEYGGSTSLRGYLKQFPNRRVDEEEAKFLFRQIVKAIDHCHKQNISHRDIKLENILLKDNKQIKLIDFGFSVIAHKETKLSVFCGTPSYMAPEIVNKQEYYGKPVDIWALGVLLYALLTGSFPFKGRDDSELFVSIRKGIYKPPHTSVSCQKLLSQMLAIRPTERINSFRILSDKWLNS